MNKERGKVRDKGDRDQIELTVQLHKLIDHISPVLEDGELLMILDRIMEIFLSSLVRRTNISEEEMKRLRGFKIS